MQSRYMPTDVFLRLEREWQKMRHAVRHLELEAERPKSDKSGLEPTTRAGMHDEFTSHAADRASLHA